MSDTPKSSITFEFATRDDCLDRMVPSDLRVLVAERDRCYDELAAAQAEIEALRDANRWRPIKTAPTDGTRILLCGRGGKIADGHYGQPPEGWANPKLFVWPFINAHPTHWRPLPVMPAPIDAAIAREEPR